MGNKEVITGVTVTWNDMDAAKYRKFEFKDGPRNKSVIPRSSNDEFKPSRIVVDLKLDLGNSNESTVTLTNAHVKIAHAVPPGKSDPPTVGWWNGSKWVKFGQFVYANNVFDVTLPPSWPIDPPVGVGP
jgi:hypothetical protein